MNASIHERKHLHYRIDSICFRILKKLTCRGQHMKFFHLSDLHIGLRLMNRDLSEDQRFVFNQITDAAKRESPDAVLIAGDIYDKAVPSAESVELFDHFISDLHAAVPDAHICMISGNHGSGPRINCFRNILSGEKIHMIGLPPERPDDKIEQLTLFDEWGPVHFYLLPFVRPSMAAGAVRTEDDEGSLTYEETIRRLIAKEDIRTDERNVIVSHQFYVSSGENASDIPRADSEIPMVGNIDAVSSRLLQVFDYAALGHIHRPMRAGSDTIRYSGTPMAYSVSEAGQEKHVLCVEMDKNAVQIKEIPLHPLHAVRIIRGTGEEILSEKSEDYVSLILTDEADSTPEDLMWRIRDAYPRVLEVKRENTRMADYGRENRENRLPDPYELCCAFLNDPGDEEKELLADVIRTVERRHM